MIVFINKTRCKILFSILMAGIRDMDKVVNLELFYELL